MHLHWLTFQPSFFPLLKLRPPSFLLFIQLLASECGQNCSWLCSTINEQLHHVEVTVTQHPILPPFLIYLNGVILTQDDLDLAVRPCVHSPHYDGAALVRNTRKP